MYKEKWWAVALQLHIVFPGVVNFCKCKKKRVWKKNTEFQEVLQTILKHNVYPGCLHSESSQGKSLIGISTSYGNQDPAVEMIGWAYEVEVLSVFKLVYPVLSYLSLSLLSPLYIVLPMELNLMSRGLNFVSKVTTGFLICRDVLSPWLVKMKCPQFILCLIKYPNAILIHGLGSLLRSSTLHFYIYMDSSRSEGGTFCWKKHM